MNGGGREVPRLSLQQTASSGSGSAAMELSHRAGGRERLDAASHVEGFFQKCRKVSASLW